MTLAFSTKSGQWTTEYSFEPTCYANTDGRMIAFKDVTDGAFWLHDGDESNRNRYYGTSYKSSLSVVSNENPSATKAYEAISLETSYDNWSIDVETLEQKGSIQSLYERENDQYAPIPKDNTISYANLVYVGSTDGASLASNIENGEIPLSKISGNMSRGVLCYKTSNSLFGIRSSGAPFPVFGTDPSSFESVVKSFSESSKSLILETSSFENGVIPNAVDQQSIPETVEIFVARSESGESMKGDYLRIDMETASAGPPAFELYAINVDQHKVNLDHSLGQNN